MKKYRRLILKYLRENGLYAVVWFGHAGVSFIVAQNDNIAPAVYSAVFEEYWDKFNTCTSEKGKMSVSFKYGYITWQACYRKLKEYGFVK